LLSAGLLAAGCQQVTSSSSINQAVCAPSNLISPSTQIAKALSAPVTDAVKSACAKSTAYTCTHRIFSPEVNDNRGVSQECTGSEGLGDVCTELDMSTFSTREALAMNDLPPAEFEPGGSMNYQEYYCKGLRGAGGKSPTLSGALDLAYASCLGGK